MAQSKLSTFSLLDLPDEILETILESLTAADKIRFMAACRKAARLTLQTAGEVTIRVTIATKAAGITQVLNSFTAPIHLKIICPPDLDTEQLYGIPSSAVDMFMGTLFNPHVAALASSSCWEGITKVTIEGILMRCLVPQFIAITCPRLTELVLERLTDCGHDERMFTEDPEDALPLVGCSSLRDLTINTLEDSVNLPPAYHSATELRQRLPNIDTLSVGGSNAADLISACAHQLTSLSVWETSEADKQAIHQCSKLRHLSTFAVILPRTAVELTTLILELEGCSDEQMSQLLRLTNLTTLHLERITKIHQDWSSHACSWRELTIARLGDDFTTLANLSLSSLKKLSIGNPDVEISLPHPNDSGSLHAVQRAVDNLSHVGKVELNVDNPNASACFGQCGSITWKVDSMQSDSDEDESDSDGPGSDSGYDEKAAELITLAAQRIGPVKTCNCRHILHLPLCLHAVLNWGHNFIGSVCVGNNYDLQPYVWQALQQLPRLHTVVFWAEFNWGSKQWDDREDHAETLLHIPSIVSRAAQQYVIPASRSLRMEFGVLDEDKYRHGDDQEETRKYYNSMRRQGQAHLRSAIPTALPTGSKLSSVKFCYTGYGNYGVGCGANKFWVVVIEPSSAAA